MKKASGQITIVLKTWKLTTDVKATVKLQTDTLFMKKTKWGSVLGDSGCKMYIHITYGL